MISNRQFVDVVDRYRVPHEVIESIMEELHFRKTKDGYLFSPYISEEAVARLIDDYREQLYDENLRKVDRMKREDKDYFFKNERVALRYSPNTITLKQFRWDFYDKLSKMGLNQDHVMRTVDELLGIAGLPQIDVDGYFTVSLNDFKTYYDNSHIVPLKDALIEAFQGQQHDIISKGQEKDIVSSLL